MSLNCVEKVRELTREQYGTFCRLHKELARTQEEIRKLTDYFPSLVLAQAGGHELPVMERNSTLAAFRAALGPSFRIMERADELSREILRQGESLLALAALIELHERAEQEAV